jgi:hypothetical protein
VRPRLRQNDRAGSTAVGGQRDREDGRTGSVVQRLTVCLAGIYNASTSAIVDKIEMGNILRGVYVLDSLGHLSINEKGLDGKNGLLRMV